MLKRQAYAAVVALCLAQAQAVRGQDMTSQVDLSSPMFTTAEMTRTEFEAALKAGDGHPAEFANKSLNGLDLSNLDLSGVNFRAARMNKTNFANSKLDGAVLFPAQASRTPIFSQARCAARNSTARIFRVPASQPI
jgi:uncharacterized protein YjbI with pentapeptide repeats